VVIPAGIGNQRIPTLIAMAALASNQSLASAKFSHVRGIAGVVARSVS
jgi:hypothetical protein